MALDLVVIHPGGARAIYQQLADEFTAVEPPLWARMIAGWLRDRGYKVAIIDQGAERLSHAKVAQQVSDLRPRLTAIVVAGHQPSASTQQMVGASVLAESLPGEVIMVGPHPSALPGRTLYQEKISYVCDGEGPLTLAALLNGVPQADVPGLVWENRGYAEKNPLAPLLPIGELNGDAWDLLPMERYRAHNWQSFDGSPRAPYASIHTSLGCPFKCSFCMINVFQHGNRYRMRSTESVVAEIEMLYAEYGVRTFKIADEMFILNDRHVRGICEGLAAKPFAEEISIWAYARVDTVKAELLPLLRDAGIRWLALGIESGSAHVRDGAEKHLDDDNIVETVRAIQAAGINVIGNYIFGLPDDTAATMRATLDLAKYLSCGFANFYSAMAYPGSRLFDAAEPGDLPERWSSYSQHSRDCTPLGTATLTAADVLRFRDDAFHEYFASSRYREMALTRFGSEALKQIDTMAGHRLERDLLA